MCNRLATTLRELYYKATIARRTWQGLKIQWRILWIFKWNGEKSYKFLFVPSPSSFIQSLRNRFRRWFKERTAPDWFAWAHVVGGGACNWVNKLQCLNVICLLRHSGRCVGNKRAKYPRKNYFLDVLAFVVSFGVFISSNGF